MSTLEFSTDPYSYLQAYLLQHYKYGKIGLVANSRHNQLARILVDNKNTVELYDVNYNGKVPEYIKFFIGAGTYHEINTAKNLAKQNNTIMLPDSDYRHCFNNKSYFSNSLSIVKAPKLVIIDKNNISYQSILLDKLSLLTDIIDILLDKSIKLEILIELRDILLDSFFNFATLEKEIKVVKLVTRLLELLNFSPMTDIIRAVNINFIDNRQNINDFNFFSYYLINLLLLQFTKSKINGIVIGSDRVVARKMQKCMGESYKKTRLHPLKSVFCNDFTLDRTDLSSLALIYRQNRDESLSYTEHTLEKAITNMLIAYEQADIDGIFAKFIGAGYIDKIIKRNNNI